MKIKHKTWKTVTITIERVLEEKKDGELTTNNTLYYLIHARHPHGSGIGFRAENPIDCWSKMMNQIHL